ncbi:MAG: ribbon-helix-helix protein, CopG family [Candidatus Poribacteria bacterium]
MEKIMITIPENLLEDVDLASERLKKNRSQLIRQAITEFLRQLKQKEFEELMAEGYQKTSDIDSQIVDNSLELQSKASEKVWAWDE